MLTFGTFTLTPFSLRINDVVVVPSPRILTTAVMVDLFLSLRIVAGVMLRNFNKATCALNAMVCSAALAPIVLTTRDDDKRDDDDDDDVLRPVMSL